MLNSTASALLEKPSPLADAFASSSLRSGKKRNSQPPGHPSRQESPKPFLPPERRRSLSSRIEEIIADPRSARCQEPCPICSDVPDAVADAALAAWDAL